MKGEAFRALVIGCGRIGAFWDKPGSESVITHAHAYHSHPGIGSLAFVDQDHGAAQKAAALWGGRAFPDLATALAEAKPQIASICTPDDTHYPVLKQLLESDVRLILAEKPLTRFSGEAEETVRRGRERGIL